INPTWSIPHIISTHQLQSSFGVLQLPTCALTCFLHSILADGCASETDFTCHCGQGNAVGKAAACIAQGCDTADGADAMKKVSAACAAVSGRGHGAGNAAGSSSSSTTTISSDLATSTVGATPSSPSPSTTITSSLTRSGPTFVATTTMKASSVFVSQTSIQSAAPTDFPLAPLQHNTQLSPGAKAGISISVSAVALSALFCLGWYIRRLKRESKAVQRGAAGDPDDVCDPRAAVPRLICARGRSLSRSGRQSEWGALQDVMTVTDNGYGVLKKKRGHVLSIVLEREEEGGRSMIARVVREPVPGQSEGLSGPLELDGVYTGLVEMPLVITPRERSVER
ncbi:hypothetical protein EJ02DRAFT_482781, partial [Clathrospora elynae]